MLNEQQGAQLLRQAGADFNAGRIDAAERSLARILTDYPDQAESLYMMASVDMRRGRPQLAAEKLQRLIAQHPDHPDLPPAYAAALTGANRAADAVRVCEDGLRRGVANPALQFELGRALGTLGRHDEAIRALRAFLDVAGDVAPAYAMLGVLYYETDDAERAFEHLYRAAKLAPDDVDTHFNIASMHAARAQHDLALTALRKVLALAPDHPGALRTIGLIYTLTNEYGRAIAPLRKVLEANPDDPLATSELVFALAIDGQAEQAVALAESYLARHSEAAFMHRQRAFAALRLGDPARALESCDIAIEEEDLPTSALSFKSAALRELGCDTEANYILGLDQFVTERRAPAPAGYTSLDAFNDDIVSYIMSDATLDYHDSNRAMKRGRGTLELFDGAEKGPALALKDMIAAAVDDYRKHLPAKPDHPFVAAAPERLDIKCWGNVYDRGGKQHVHFHPPAWLSGVYYPRLPATMLDNTDDIAGGLELGRAYYRLGLDDDPPVRVIVPEEGTMVLFPSYVGHQTIPVSDTDEPRVSIAFDIVPG